MEFDTIVKNATVVTAAEVLPKGLDIGIRSGKISSLAFDLQPSPNTVIIDAEGAYVTPGGVDSHVHLAQDNAPTGDSWLTGTRSAIAGGNTTVIAFATQKRSEESLFPAVDEYRKRSDGQAYCDYGFHLILTNPTEKILQEELKSMILDGITSVKLYMTYEPMKLTDGGLLDAMMATRELGMTTMIHAENADMIDMVIKRLLARNHTAPEFHAVARPQIAETEATYRAICLSTLCDAPILLVHMSSPPAVAHVRSAQTEGLPIHAETCPHYLTLISEALRDHPDHHWSGAKCVCAPPLRHTQDDLDAMWRAVANGTINVFSSDHAPSKWDHPAGKKKPLQPATGPAVFSTIPNGLPGIETRLPLLFTHAVGPDAKISLPKFVELTSTNPAKLYGLGGVKGSLAPGYDADIVIWYPEGQGRTTITQDNLHHDIDYTPFEGIEVKNWPRLVLLRGKVAWDKGNGGVLGGKSDGMFLRRKKGQVLVGQTGKETIGMKQDNLEAIDVIRHGVGLRPVRENGIRIEREAVKDEKGENEYWVIYNIGHGGTGFQSSWGCSKKVKELVDQITADSGEPKEKARL